MIYEFIKAVAPDIPITKVINLEQHYDPIFGNSFFIDKGAKIEGHELSKLSKESLDEYIEACNDEIKIERRRKNKEACIYFANVKPFEIDHIIQKDTKLDVEGVNI